ncbi:hypothetical protein [Enterococcus hirae]|uniref:hypothetical protein n=1 Tax=Enterococcus hirae TaxID=1354 RepID=UPI001369342D|nr:hypothetical protein [Enterococcus hirae]NAE18033.1 hypothetical protein [Enterococcus hirae]
MTELPALVDLEPRRRSGLGPGVVHDERYQLPARHNIFTALKAHDARFSHAKAEVEPRKAEGPVEQPAFVEPPALDDVPLAVSAVVLENPQREDEVAEVVTVTGLGEHPEARPQPRLSDMARALDVTPPGVERVEPEPVVEVAHVVAPRRRSLSDALAEAQQMRGA